MKKIISSFVLFVACAAACGQQVFFAQNYTLGSSAATQPTLTPGTGSYTGTQTVTISSTSGGIICYNTAGSPATNGTTGCTTGTLINTNSGTSCVGGSTVCGDISVAATETVYAVAGGTGYTDSSVGSATYTISVSGLAIVPGTCSTSSAHCCVIYAGSTTSPFQCTVTGVSNPNGLMIWGSSSISTVGFTDSAGTPETPITVGSSAGNSGVTVVANASSGSHTITMTNCFFQCFLHVQEYSGVATSAPIGASSTNPNAFSPAVGSAITTTQANSMTVALIMNGGGSSATTWGSLTGSFVQRQTYTANTSEAWSTADNVATLNGTLGSSINTQQPYTGGGNFWQVILVEIKHQ